MKKIISCVAFCVLVLFLAGQFTELLTPKSQNRYYILEQYLRENPKQNEHDVQVFGSCHSYTSFNPMYLEAETGVSAFVYGNAGEIIPTTYARMAEQFDRYVPKVALVEIWGINPYETYSTHERVFGFYLANNLERVTLSRAKQEVIRDFSHMEYADINALSMNFPFLNYRDRLVDGSLTEVDFRYSFEGTEPYSTNYMFKEMTSRLQYNGFKKNSNKKIEDYPDKQEYINEGEFMEIEPDIVEYIQKIIDLCREKDVELIFYRAPYTSKVNELKKLNHLRQICEYNGVLFFDLEEELSFNYRTDFLDYEHLSEIGANKATQFLMPYILEALGIGTEDLKPTNLLKNGGFTNPENTKQQDVYEGAGETVDGWFTNYSGDTVALTPNGIQNVNQSVETGWHLHQVIEDAGTLAGESLIAVFEITDYVGTKLRPVISCRDAEDKEIWAAAANIRDGKVTVNCAVPEGTQYIRVGFFAYEGVAAGDYIVVKSAALYSEATLPTNWLENGNFTNPENVQGKTDYKGVGETVDHWYTNYKGDTVTLTSEGIKNVNQSEVTGWHLHQVIEEAGNLVGKSLTAVFEIVDYGGTKIIPVISCRDAEDKEIRSVSANIADGSVTVTCVVPEGTQYIRVGLYAYEEVAPGDYVVVRSAALYEGAYTVETLPF